MGAQASSTARRIGPPCPPDPTLPNPKRPRPQAHPPRLRPRLPKHPKLADPSGSQARLDSPSPGGLSDSVCQILSVRFCLSGAFRFHQILFNPQAPQLTQAPTSSPQAGSQGAWFFNTAQLCLINPLRVCRRPYRVECTGSLPTSEVKRHRARLVLGWGTAWEDLRVLSAFFFFTTSAKTVLDSLLARGHFLLAAALPPVAAPPPASWSPRVGPRLRKIVYTSRFVRVILAQGPC